MYLCEFEDYIFKYTIERDYCTEENEPSRLTRETNILTLKGYIIAEMLSNQLKDKNFFEMIIDRNEIRINTFNQETGESIDYIYNFNKISLKEYYKQNI